MTFRSITHVIYDLDGLLLNTEPFYTRVTQQIVQRFGKTFDWSLKAQMIGKHARESAQILVDGLELPITAEEYLIEREQLLRELFPSSEPMPGAIALVEHLHRHGVPQAVATSSDRLLFDIKTRRHSKWMELFETIVTGDDPELARSKPAPDIFLLAARRINADPRHCLVLEDAPSGMEAAVAADMAVVIVPDPHIDRTLFSKADQVLNSLDEFRPGEWGLPPRESAGIEPRNGE
jgi:HAD superfamily hydrolase (TIGR01509 family)